MVTKVESWRGSGPIGRLGLTHTHYFSDGADGKESTCNAGDLVSILGLERSPGGSHGNPLQYIAWRIPWTEEPGGLQSIGVAKSLT